MARQLNGYAKWITIAISILAIIGGIGAQFIRQGEDIGTNTSEIVDLKDGIEKYIWPEIEASKQHRIEGAVSQKYMEKRFDMLEDGMNQILNKLDTQ